MSTASVSNLIESFLNVHGGPAKSERFAVTITPPLGLSSLLGGLSYDLTFQCETSSLPGVLLNTQSYRTYGPSRKIVTQTVFDEITFSIYCSNNFWEKPYFDAWLDYINPRLNGYDFRYKDEYVGAATINQFNMTDQVIYTVNLIKCFPVSMTPLHLSWEEDSMHRLVVSFAYDRYTITNEYGSIITNTNSLPLGTVLGNLNNPTQFIG